MEDYLSNIDKAVEKLIDRKSKLIAEKVNLEPEYRKAKLITDHWDNLCSLIDEIDDQLENLDELRDEYRERINTLEERRKQLRQQLYKDIEEE